MNDVLELKGKRFVQASKAGSGGPSMNSKKTVTSEQLFQLRYGAGVKGKVVEALYHGAAIVTTSVGAEGIADAKQVMTVEDEAASLAAGVLWLYSNPKECEELSRKAQAYVRERYSVDAAWSVVGEDFV